MDSSFFPNTRKRRIKREKTTKTLLSGKRETEKRGIWSTRIIKKKKEKMERCSYHYLSKRKGGSERKGR